MMIFQSSSNFSRKQFMVSITPPPDMKAPVRVRSQVASQRGFRTIHELELPILGDDEGTNEWHVYIEAWSHHVAKMHRPP